MENAWIIGLVVVVLVGSRVFTVKNYLNRKLKNNSTYTGTIGDLDFELWRGSCQLHDIFIAKKTGAGKVPFFAASELDLTVQWKELFHRTVVGEVMIRQPRVYFVSPRATDSTPSGNNLAMDEALKNVFPFRLTRLEISNGQIHFQNEHSSPPVDLYVNDFTVVATNFTNTRGLKDELPARVNAHGVTVGGGALDIQLRLNPLAPAPTFELVCEVRKVNLVAINDFLKAYGKFDVERGVFSLFTSVASKNGSYEGSVKVVFENLNVFAWEKERKKNVLEIFWQAVVGTFTTLFKNQAKDRLATEIPVAGVGVWSAVFTLLQNAFIRALLPKVDRLMTVEEVKRRKENEKASSPSTTPPDAKAYLKA